MLLLCVGHPNRDDLKLQYALRVRPAKVKEALDWLFKNNDVYKRKLTQREIAFSQDNLDAYSDDAVPDTLVLDAVCQQITPREAVTGHFGI